MKILVVNGYPGKKGLSREISLKYKEKYSIENQIRLVNVYDLNFDLILHEGYSGNLKLEKDLVQVQKDIKWADKIVLVFPIWWGGMPSLLRAFMERVLLPGFAFEYVKGKPRKLLKGKKAELIATAGGPKWYYKTLGRIDQRRTLGKLLRFCGIKLGKIRIYGGINPGIDKKEIKRILNEI